MTGQAVSKEEVGDIMAYVSNPPEDLGATADASAACPTIDYDKVEESDSANAIWFIILFILFITIALSASGVKRSLTDMLAEKNGEDLLPDSSYLQRFGGWAWNNLVFVSLIGLFFVFYGIGVGYSALMDIGIYTNYSPDQPIEFIHSVHVCENEIDCKYCHNSAYDSKHAGIPSANVCMNCHKAIKKGKNNA